MTYEFYERCVPTQLLRQSPENSFHLIHDKILLFLANRIQTRLSDIPTLPCYGHVVFDASLPLGRM
jgi:hypothetical protein